MASIESGVLALQNELEKAKESLKDVDENIKKLTGRDPTGQRPGGNRRVSQSGDSRGRGRPFTPGGRRFPDNDGQAARRLVGGAFSRLGINPRAAGRGRGRGRRTADSEDEEELPNKPTIQSSVVLTPKEPRSRQASLDEQKQDKKGTARNRRMFGLLLGTLQKFKDEAKETKDKEDQRKQIENKLEEKAKEEKEEIIQERRQLFQERRQTQAKLRKIEQKIEIVETSQECQAERLKLVNFIRTKAKPHIFYLPKLMNDILEGKKKETAQVINEMITKKQKQLEEEIEDLMAERPGHHEEDEEETEHTVEGEEGEGDKNKGEQTDKENRVIRHYRSKADELEEQEDTTNKKRQKSSGDRGEKRKSGDDRDHERSKHRKSDEHHKDVHRSETERTNDNRHRKSDNSGDRNEGRHQRFSRGEGDKKSHREGEKVRNRGEGERKRSRDERDRRESHGDNDKRRSHGDDGRREERRSHGDGHENERDGKKKEHRSREQSKRTEKKEDGVKVAIDYDEQEEGEANEDTNKAPSVPEIQPEFLSMDFSNMADIPMPDEPMAPKDS